MQKKQAGTDQLIAQIIRGIEDVKGQDIEILDLRDIENTVCDYFIICNGTSNTQVNAIVILGMWKEATTLNGFYWTMFTL